MQVHLSEPSLVDDLLAFLLDTVQCVAVADAAGNISVSIPDVVPEDAKRRELDLCLRVWRAMYPDVAVRLLP